MSHLKYVVANRNLANCADTLTATAAIWLTDNNKIPCV